MQIALIYSQVTYSIF